MDRYAKLVAAQKDSILRMTVAPFPRFDGPGLG